MEMQFTPVTQVDLSTTQTSNSFIVPEAGTVTINNGELYVNNVAQGTSSSVNADDNITIQLTSSSSYITPSFSVLTYNNETHVFCVITKDNAGIVYDPALVTKVPLSLITESESSNVINVFNVNTDAVLATIDTAVVAVPNGYDIYAPRDYVFVVNPFDNTVSRIDLVANLVVENIPVGNRPSSVASSQGPAGRSVIYVTNTLDNTVSRLALDTYQEEDVIPVGSRPTHIVNDVDFNLWVVNSGSTSVTFIEPDLLDHSIRTVSSINIGHRPTDIIAVDGYVFVTCIEDDVVVRISTVDHSLTIIPVGQAPLGLATDVINYVYVANSYSGTVSVIDVSSATVVQTIDVGDYPAYIHANTTHFWVTDLQSNYVTKYLSGTDVVVSSFLVPPRPYGIAEGLPDTLWVASLYSDAPDRFVARDSTTQDFDFYTVLNAGRGMPLSTQIHVIEDITYDVPVTISPDSDSSAVIIKNSVDVGTATTVSLYDEIALQIQTSNLFDSIQHATVVIGSTVESWYVHTPIADRQPDFFEFVPVVVGANTTMSSNVVEISGLSPGYILDVVVNIGTIIKNGTPIGSSGTVVNGDLLSIQLVSASSFCTDVIAYLETSGPFSSFFVLAVPKNFTSNDIHTQPEWDFPDVVGIAADIPLFSNKLAASGLTVASDVTVGDQHDAVLYINNVPVGKTGTVSNGDEFRVLIQTPDVGDMHFQVPIMMCGHTYVWNITTAPDVQPNPFTFRPLINKYANREYISDPEVILGATANTPLLCVVRPATRVYVNDELVVVDTNGDPVELAVSLDPDSEFSFYIEQEDRVALAGAAGSVFGQTRTYTLDIQGIQGTFSLTSFSLGTDPSKVLSNPIHQHTLVLHIDPPEPVSTRHIPIGDVNTTLPIVHNTVMAHSTMPSGSTVMYSDKLALPPQPLVQKHDTKLLSMLSASIQSRNDIYSDMPDVYTQSRNGIYSDMPTADDFRHDVISLDKESVLPDPYIYIQNIVGHPASKFEKAFTRNKIITLYTDRFSEADAIRFSLPLKYYVNEKHNGAAVDAVHYKYVRGAFRQFTIKWRQWGQDRPHRLVQATYRYLPRDEYRTIDHLYHRYPFHLKYAPRIYKQRYYKNWRPVDALYSKSLVNIPRLIDHDYHRYLLHDTILVNLRNAYRDTYLESGSALRVPHRHLYEENNFTRLVELHHAVHYEYGTLAHPYSVLTHRSTGAMPEPVRNVLPVCQYIELVPAYHEHIVIAIDTHSPNKYITSIKQIIPNAVDLYRNYETAFSPLDQSMFNCADLGYLPSVDAAIVQGQVVQPDTAYLQTYEIRPGCFIWAQYVNQDARCIGASLSDRISGWIHGG